MTRHQILICEMNEHFDRTAAQWRDQHLH
jgi:hypothetical protein